MKIISKEYFENRFFYKSPYLNAEDITQNERRINIISSISMYIYSFILITYSFFSYEHYIYQYFSNGLPFINIIYIVLITLTILQATVSLILKGKNKWIKYINSLIINLCSFYFIFFFTSPIILLASIPIIIDVMYCSRSYIIFNVLSTIVSAILVFLFYCIIYKSHNEILDLFKSDYAFSSIIYLLIYIFIAFICLLITIEMQKFMITQGKSLHQKAKLQKELTLASQIQEDMLPHSFPAFPTHEELDLHAIMTPAKEVGGDFYYYFTLDSHKIVIIIADVSGKGIPASLFMAKTITLIKSYTQMRLSPSEIFTRVNRNLCSENDSELFVTAWLGILDISTNTLCYSNAGHSAPLFKSQNNNYVFLREANMVLGVFETTRYKEYEIEMKPKDQILLYTDGVTEALNINDEIFGEERLINILNQNTHLSSKDLLNTIENKVKDFTSEAEQSDDITMLSLKYNTNEKLSQKVFDASLKEIDNVYDFINENLKNSHISNNDTMKIQTVTEELFTNITFYAYKDTKPEKVCIKIYSDENEIKLIFMDNGFPFNPLDVPKPNFDLPEEERPIGGLGIHIMRSFMDYVHYEYKDNQNILIIKKELDNNE